MAAFVLMDSPPSVWVRPLHYGHAEDTDYDERRGCDLTSERRYNPEEE
jgi:hypothetical protein